MLFVSRRKPISSALDIANGYLNLSEGPIVATFSYMQSESFLKMFSASSEDYRDTLSWRLKHAPPQDKWIYEFGLKFKMCEYDFKYLQNSLAKEREEDEDIAAARKRGEDEIGLNFLRARRILKQWEENNEREF